MADKKFAPVLSTSSNSALIVHQTDYSNPYVTSKVPKLTSPSNSGALTGPDNHVTIFKPAASQSPGNNMPSQAIPAEITKTPAESNQNLTEEGGGLGSVGRGGSGREVEETSGGNQYNFLKFHNVEDDENATDESNKSVDIKETAGKRKGSQGSTTLGKGGNSGDGAGNQPQVIKRSNIKAAALVNNYLAPNQQSQQQPMHNPIVTQVMKQQGWDKIKNLKSVLDNRKSGKGNSGTRQSAKQSKHGAETPPQLQSQGQNRQVYTQGKKSSKKQTTGQAASMHHTSFDNSKLPARKSSQDNQNSGKRPPSQTSKNSGKAPSSGNRGHRMASSQQQTPGPHAKSRESPLMTLEKGTSGSNGASNKQRKKQSQEKFLVPDPLQVVGRKSDIEKGRDPFGTIEQPDNEYLETMRQRIRGLPELNKNQNNSGSLHQQLPKKASYEQLDAMNTQEIIDRANQLISEKDRQPSHIENRASLDQLDQNKIGEKVLNQGVASTANETNNQKNLEEQNLLRSPFESIDMHATGQFPNESPVFETKNQSQDPDSQARDELIEVDKSIQMIDQIFGQASHKGLSGNAFRRPKFLQNKLQSLMRDTKSSAQRNRYRPQPGNNNIQTPNLGASSIGLSNEEAHGQKKSPLKGSGKLQSPKKRQYSPFQKFKYSTRSSQNLKTIISLKEVSPGKFERIKQSSTNKNEQPFEYIGSKYPSNQAHEQSNNQTGTLQILDSTFVTPQLSEIPPTDSPTQITLEGISGMVLVDASQHHEGAAPEDEEAEDGDRGNATLAAGTQGDKENGTNGLASLLSGSELQVNNGNTSNAAVNSQASKKSAVNGGSPIKKTLDLEQIKIDQKELHEISKSSREMQNIRNTKNNEFNAELKNIIGSINSRTKVLKATFSLNATQNSGQHYQDGRIQDAIGRTSLIEPGMEQTQTLKQFDNLNRQTMGSSYTQRSNRVDINKAGVTNQMTLTDDGISGMAAVDDEEDPLKAVALEFSSEANDLEAGCSFDKNEQKNILTLDQTIVVTEELDDINNLDDLQIAQSATDTQQDRASELNRRTSQFTDLEIERLKDKNDDKQCIQITIEDLQELVDNMKVKHRAEIDAILTEQGVYKRIIQELIMKLTKSQHLINSHEIQILGLQKYEKQAIKFAELNAKLQSEVEFYRSQTDKLKIAIVEYDMHVRDSIVVANEFHISQLETENAHLRKLLNIPHELFVKDTADKKKNVLKSIDEKLKAAEKRIARKQTAYEIQFQQQMQHGVDQFALDQDEYDRFRLKKLKNHQDMPEKMKKQLQGKIHTKIEEKQYRDEVRRSQEKEILLEFARVYGYDVNKHQPEHCDGEIDVDYLQAYIAECRQKEDQETEQITSAMQDTEHEQSTEIQQQEQENFSQDKSQNQEETQQQAQSSTTDGTDSQDPADESQDKKQLIAQTDPDENSCVEYLDQQKTENASNLEPQDDFQNQLQDQSHVKESTQSSLRPDSEKKPEEQTKNKNINSPKSSSLTSQNIPQDEQTSQNQNILQLQVPKEVKKEKEAKESS